MDIGAYVGVVIDEGEGLAGLGWARRGSTSSDEEETGPAQRIDTTEPKS